MKKIIQQFDIKEFLIFRVPIYTLVFIAMFFEEGYINVPVIMIFLIAMGETIIYFYKNDEGNNE